MPRSPQSRAGRKITRPLLRQFDLPRPAADGDKEARGRVLVVGGEASLPGAVVLAGIAALRAGAGKLQIATCRSVAAHVGVAIPESLSLGLAETRAGALDPDSADELRGMVHETDALLIGPGMSEKRSNTRFVLNLLDAPTKASVVLDSGALAILTKHPEAVHARKAVPVLTPHAGEMAIMLAMDREDVEADPSGIARRSAESLSAVVVLKGARTFVATPSGELFRYESGDVGLATSGSGDTLSGIVAGLLARGASPLVAALWAVHLHGAAGNVLARRFGRVGYLARELLDEIPKLMRS